MDKIKQLVEMGATAAQARAALKQYKDDVHQAAERIFEGQFDNVVEESDPAPKDVRSTSNTNRVNDVDMEDADDEEGVDDDEGSDVFVDYDSDDEGGIPGDSRTHQVNDPYAGIFFSKDRREEVIEVEEEPVLVTVPGVEEQVELMSQGKWMAGCPEGGEQSFLFSLYSQLSGVSGGCPCPSGCGTTAPRSAEDFFAIYSKFSTYIEQLRKTVRTCTKCQTEFCFACGEKVSRGQGFDPLWHCANFQGVILGVGLFMVERLFEQQKDSSESKLVSEREPKRRRKVVDVDDDDDIRSSSGKKSKGGIGYAGDQKEDTSGQAEAQAQQFSKDEKVRKLLAEVRVYLPSLHRPGGGRTSDYLPHPSSLTHLRRRFNLITADLLRNDSLADMSDRNQLYFELLEWLETISNHEALASMMPMPIMRAGPKSIVVKKTNSSTVRERVIVYEGSPSPRELLEAIAIQARAALKGLESSKPHFEDAAAELSEEQKRRAVVDAKGKSKEDLAGSSDETTRLSNFCNRLLVTTVQIDRSLRELKGEEFLARMHASLPKSSTSVAEDVYVDAGETEEDAKKAYMEWATETRFKYCELSIPGKDDEPPSYKHYFTSEARMLTSSNLPKRSLAIAKELAILTTNLPVAWGSSIFLRVDEERVDIIKCLITGPEGTPYHNGCYLFDIFLGASYNQTPPSVKYMTTYGGKYRFNPNLYADGKVCLSLLGTWQGPGWVPSKSTLLQVLISIQSMILNEEPYLNEPGWASSGGTPQSKAYSANIRRMVVRAAMLDALKNPPEPFSDVIKTHFRLKGRSIAKQLDSWLQQDDGKQTHGDGAEYSIGRSTNTGSASSNGFQEDIDALKKLLTEL